ncbi:MAG: hypothetical protein HC888_00210 [Candidatus Competibacteraceae bacterium]|nr:hypothetical protein [Candidatus Competibacteraceae bacterium]
MSSPIIIGISGKKQSGKSSLCNFIEASIKQQDYARKGGSCSFAQDDVGNIEWIFAPGNVEAHRSERLDPPLVSVYSFADRLKSDVCVNLLGLTIEQVYGTDEQKNQLTNFTWDRLPQSIAFQYSNEYVTIQNPLSEDGEDFMHVPRTGRMTAREVMQVVGTDVFRKMFDDQIWVNSTYSRIARDKPKYAIISDVRFRAEVDSIISRGGYVIRLGRQVAGDNHASEIDLDGYDWLKHSDKAFYVENDDWTIHQKNAFVYDWLAQRTLIG